jgi:hypothetical protein
MISVDANLRSGRRLENERRSEFIYIYINVWKSSQRMNLRDVGSETSVNDSVQTNKNDK